MRFTPIAFLGEPLNIEYIIVAGGGGAVWSSTNFNQTAGGGGGGVISGSATILPGSYVVTIGTGGTGINYLGNALNGNNSSFLELTAIGGGAGSSYSNGFNGGSGGGGGQPYIGGAGTTGQGFAGSGGSPTLNEYGGSGGGASSAASGGSAGNGITWYNGFTASGGGVGRGFNVILPTILGTYGRGGTAFSTYGSTANGRDGAVMLRYEGTQLLNGGTISQAGGYTYHLFTSSSVLDY